MFVDIKPMLAKDLPEFSRTVSKRRLSRRHLSVSNLKFDFIFNGGHTREEKKGTLTKAASIPPHRQKAQGILDLFFDAAPHLMILIFFQFLELNTKAAFAKAAFDTL